MSLPREMGIIAADEFMQTLRSKKALFALGAIGLAFIAVYLSDALQVLMLVLFAPAKILPLSLLLSYLLFLSVIPVLCLLFGFDLLSGEVQSQTARFITTYYSRTALVIGRFVGSWLFIAATILAVMLSAATYALAKLSTNAFGQACYVSLYLSLFAAAILSLVCFLSSITSRQTTTLYLSTLCIAALVLLKDQAWISPFSQLSITMALPPPIGWMPHFLLFSAACLLLSIIAFQRRDL